MTIYIAADGSFGDADNLVLISDHRWRSADYDAINTWNERSLLAYAEAVSANPALRPTEWEKQQ